MASENLLTPASPLERDSALISTPHPSEVVTVLCVSPFDDDHRRLESFFLHSNWKLYRAMHCDEALQFLRSHHTPVIISEGKVAGHCWKYMLEEISSLPFQPLPRLIVASRLADDQLWSEVLNLGGYNVLEKPFNRREVFWVVSQAWLDWKSEWERSAATQLRSLSRAAGTV